MEKTKYSAMSKVPFDVKADFKRKVLSVVDAVHGGSERLPVPFDEAEQVLDKLSSEWAKTKAILADPLMNSQQIDAIIASSQLFNAAYIVNEHRDILLNFYRGILIEIMDAVTAFEGGSADMMFNVTIRLKAILEAHQHNIPTRKAPEKKSTDNSEWPHDLPLELPKKHDVEVTRDGTAIYKLQPEIVGLYDFGNAFLMEPVTIVVYRSPHTCKCCSEFKKHVIETDTLSGPHSVAIDTQVTVSREFVAKLALDRNQVGYVHPFMLVEDKNPKGQEWLLGLLK